MELRVPLDFERWPEFRELTSAVGSRIFASHVFMRLWVDLGHLAGVTNRPGLLPCTSASLFKSDLGITGAPDASMAPVSAQVCLDALIATAESPLRFLALVKEGETLVGYQCGRFAQNNPQLAPDYKPFYVRGNEVSRFVRKQKKDEVMAFSQALLIPDKHFQLPDGGRMDPETTRRVTLLIRSVDNALGLPSRQPGQFSEGLIADSHRICTEFKDEDLSRICRKILEHRTHPVMPKTTEQLLPRWHEVARMVA